VSVSGVRISAGEFKGSRLKVPSGVRPTAQRVREALCSRWQTRLPGASVLDLFAGSGAVGLEAASRGAARVLLIEADHRVHKELTAACARLAPEITRTHRASLPEDLARAVHNGVFDLVFADPPYAFEEWEGLLAAVADLIETNGEAVFEHSRRVVLPDRVGRLEQRSTRRYGDSALSFFEVGTPAGDARSRER
jgi:16S rRNA (guanine966-N2)-methyltransferase